MPSSFDESSIFLLFTDALAGGQIALALLLSWTAGLLTSLSPCVYPLIPITLSLMGAKKYHSPLAGFLIAVTYVLGMTLVYTCLGIIFAYAGLLVGSFMQSPLAIALIAIILASLSLAMLGLINVVLPSAWMARLSQIGGSGFRGAFFMGMVAGLIAAPCTGPVLGFVLTLIAQKSDPLFGISLMISFSLGLGLPFLLLGTFSSLALHLPRSGPWMEQIKSFLAAAILSSSFYYFSLIASDLLSCLRWLKSEAFIGLSVVFVSIAILWLSSRKIWRLLGVVLLAMVGASLMTSPATVRQIEKGELTWHLIDHQSSIARFDELLKEGQEASLPILIDFYADWCSACHELDAKTLSDPAVLKELENFLLIRIDASKNASVIASLEDRFHIIGLPTLILIDKKGAIMPPLFGAVLVPVLLPKLRKLSAP